MYRRRDYAKSARAVLGDVAKIASVAKTGQYLAHASGYGKSSKAQKALTKALKPRKTLKTDVRSLKSKVKKISQELQQDVAHHTHRNRRTSRLTSSVNQVGYDVQAYTIANLETAMASFRYFDPATSALVVSNPSSGTYQQDITVKRIVNTMKCRNNYQVPCQLVIYGLKPKVDTSIGGNTYFTAGIADQGNPGTSSPLVHLTDSEQFKDAYKIVVSKKVLLNPGQECNLTYSFKEFLYSPALVDTHTVSYQAKLNGFQWFLRVGGVLGHDTTVAEVGTLNAGIDYQADCVYTFQYDAGTSLDDFSIADTSDTFTNGGVITSKPVADNIGYSVA